VAVVLITRGRFAIVCVVVAAAALAHHGWLSHWSNRYVIRNATGATLGAVHVVARHLDGRVAFEQTVADLPADSSAAIRHALDDSRLSLDFEMVGACRWLRTGAAAFVQRFDSALRTGPASGDVS
jgi:hypothetical protein